MRNQEIVTAEFQKKKKRKSSKYKREKSKDVDQHGFLKDDESTGSEISIENNVVSNVSSVPKVTLDKKKTLVAIDCEMVGVGPEKKSALARCSIINYDGNVVFDNFIKPEEEITDYRTQWSGIRPSDMAKAIPFRKARRQARRLLKGRVLVGHSLQSDLTVLQLKHPHHCMRDTAKFIPLRAMAGLPTYTTPALKTLTRNVLKTEIQTSEHCSIEDARASLSLYKCCESEWENEWEESKSTSYLCDAYWPSWTRTN